MVQETTEVKPALPRFFTLEMLMFTLTALSGLVLIWSSVSPYRNIAVLIVAGIVFTFSLVIVIRLLMDPDSVRARQSDAMLRLASQTLDCMKEGLTRDAAQRICQLLLPSTAAIAVAITDKDHILGYAGYEEAENPSGSIIRTHATHATLADGHGRILLTPEEIGFPSSSTTIQAAIIVPLTVGHSVAGTLKFYYRRARHISETQKSIAEGFGQLLSTQMAASALEEQTKLATSMELKALQSQINPHFLFNTINTIASLIRTDPEKARILLREFAVFYRRTLEDSADLIVFAREMEQTKRYFTFEIARFGEDRVAMEVDIDPAVDDMMVPPFLIQPLVENAVRHAMPSEGKLTIRVTGTVEGDDVIVCVADDGVGMTEEARQNILHPESSTGCGIAVKNVHDRICGYFGPDTHMDVESELGAGTKVTLVLKNGAQREFER
ncbi:MULTISPECIES: histidine kinase [Gordonibacter]|uniref:Histidine kinase n=1 Tax=Gordonibacter faecis TaxID=3047475 RepID=A0ABT7DPJ4_9ACTN|nr:MULTISPECIES: histidine kinase [unclassified Gordonibacter]MDJ1651465.1 histidine kinase [Gordonibacter sp. KGMB12511]HIW76057.1 histidine kinase [Candidatus Gordonibacter avicola]